MNKQEITEANRYDSFVIGSSAMTWHLFLFNLPTNATNLRISVWRRLQKLGALNLKNGAYILPFSQANEEDFHWVAEEIKKGGGDTSIFVAQTTETEEKKIIQLFNNLIEKRYKEFIQECSDTGTMLKKQKAPDLILKLKSTQSQLLSQLSRIDKIDFFQSQFRKNATEAVEHFCEMNGSPESGPLSAPAPVLPVQLKEFAGKTWVTRKGMYIDRLSSSWFIKKFIDKDAEFQTVSPETGLPQDSNKISFDMFGSEFGHHGNDCTFETFIRRFNLGNDRALVIISQIVHNMDLKDEKFARPETAGVELMIKGLRAKHEQDDTFMGEGHGMIESLYVSLRKKENENVPKSQT